MRYKGLCENMMNGCTHTHARTSERKAFYNLPTMACSLWQEIKMDVRFLQCKIKEKVDKNGKTVYRLYTSADIINTVDTLLSDPLLSKFSIIQP